MKLIRLMSILGLLALVSACNFPTGATPTEPPETPPTSPTLDGGGLAATDAPQPTPTGTSEPLTSPQGSSAAPTQSGSGCTDRAAFISDVTFNDFSELTPGEMFVKVWRLENTGTCTWTTQYRLSFFGGDRMEGILEVPLMDEVAPGEQVEVSVDLVAPEEPGEYQGFWKLRNAQSQFFGIGPEGDQSFWVKIVVTAPLETGTPTSTASPTVPVMPSGTPTPTQTPTGTPSATPE